LLKKTVTALLAMFNKPAKLERMIEDG